LNIVYYFINNYIFKQVKKFPQKSGVYLMGNKQGQVVYIGKASCLRIRVSSYYNKSLDSKTQSLMDKVKKLITK